MNNTPIAKTATALRSRQVVWAALFLALAVAALSVALVVFAARDIRANQLEKVELLARTLDDQTASVVSATDGILRALQAVAEQPAARGEITVLSPLLADSLRGRPFLRSVSWIDAEGRVLASSNEANRDLRVPSALLAGSTVPKRGVRVAALASGRDIGDLGPPGRDSARAFVLPVVLPVGEAYLLALINPDHLATQFDRLLDGAPLRALLLGLDGELLAATSGVQTAPGESMRALPAFTQFLPARESGSGEGVGSDGRPVLSAFRTTRHWPLVVVVEQPREVLLHHVMVVAKWALAFLVTSWLLIGLAAAVARRALMRDERLSQDLSLAHAATSESESRKLAILQSSLDAIVTVDPQGRIVEFNAAAESMFGHAVGTVLGKPMHELIVPPHHRSAHEAGMARYQSTGVSRVLNRRIEVEALRADGSCFPVELTIVPVATESGEFFTATLRDITERQRVDGALRDSEARARATFEQAAVGVLQQDFEGRVTRVNQTLCHMLDYSRDELLALKVNDIVHPQDFAAAAEGIRALSTGEVTQFASDRRYRRKDGGQLWARLTLSIARDDHGQPLYMIGIIEDISARRRAEAELAAARQRELEVGARIQQSLLVTPPPAELDGVHFSSFSQASQGIDGDFVEILRVGPHCVDLIVGDVMGKGLAAAMMGAGTKLQFSRSMAELLTQRGAGQSQPQPADIVAAVHRAMTPTLQALEAFVTLCYLRIDTEAGRITWVGCGHEEPLLVPAGGEVGLLGNQHPPLGVLDTADYRQDSTPLAPGDALFLCSDGVTDAMRLDGERIGHERVVDAAVRRLRAHASPAAVLHSLRVDLLQAGVRMQDDVTMVIVQRQADPEPLARVELPLRLDVLHRVRSFVVAHAAAAGLDEAACGLLEVACVEAFTNIVRHGLGLLEGAPLELLARLHGGALVIELVHLGLPFQPPTELKETDFGAFPEGGFGLLIIQGASDGVEYLHADGVNTIRMTKRLR